MEKVSTKKKKNYKALVKKNLLAWLIMLPSLILFAFFVWTPLIKNVILSFFSDYSFKEFVGFKNYQALFQDVSFIAALKNTFKYIFWSLLIGFLVPMIIGFLLSEVIHAKGFFRVCIYIPCMISGIAVVFLFKNVYGDETYSILNVILKAFGGTPRKWASDPNIIIPLIVIAMTWKGAGGTALIYLSNFQQIDSSLYEAARMDGAKPFQRFARVMMPQMRNTILTLLVLQIISVFQVFYEPLVIGNWSGPLDSSMSLMLLAYKFAFNDLEFAKGAAASIFLALIILAFTLAYFALVRYLNKEEKQA
ncbi:aBC-type transporter integral membrane subunit [Coprobacillus sp. CAG:826]|nr:aBC-type transporter integral membrane subunit [Coprobacillus sp. CAG:826]